MATLASLTLDVWDMLYGMPQVERPEEDTLSTQVTDAADVSWRFTTAALWRRGDYAEYWKNNGTAGEVVVMATDHPTGAADVTVRRAQQRSSAEAGAIAAGAVFLHNPTYTVTKIQRAITETIDNDLWPKVFYRSERSLTPAAGTHRYDLADEDYLVEEVFQYDVSATDYNPFPPSWWEVVTDQPAGVTATGRTLRLFRWYSTTDDVYYTARSKPVTADVASFPDALADMIPWGACARLLATSAPPKRVDPTRSGRGIAGQSASQEYVDAGYFQTRFDQMKRQYRLQLEREKQAPVRWKRPSYMHIRK